MMNKKIFAKKLMVLIAPLAFALIGYFALYFSAQPIISPIMSIISIMSSSSTENTEEFKDIYSGEVFHSYTESVPSSEITFPLCNTKYGEITVEGTSVNSPLIFGDSIPMLRKGACQYMGSSFPGFGSTILVSAHNTTYFNGLRDAKVGAIITVKTNYGIYTYRITEVGVKNKDNPDNFDLSADSENIVLYTCWPYGVVGYKTERLFVYGEYVSGPRVLLDR